MKSAALPSSMLSARRTRLASAINVSTLSPPLKTGRVGGGITIHTGVGVDGLQTRGSPPDGDVQRFFPLFGMVKKQILSVTPVVEGEGKV